LNYFDKSPSKRIVFYLGDRPVWVKPVQKQFNRVNFLILRFLHPQYQINSRAQAIGPSVS
jgi:hypothetical protein